MSWSNCCFFTCMQISQEAGQMVWYSQKILSEFPTVYLTVIHTVKGFGIVNKAEIDVFLELSCFSDDPTDVGNLISGSSAFSKTNLNTWKFMVHILLKPGLENFEHYFTSMWDECNCAVVWAFFGIAFLCDWNENWPFPVLWPLLSFPDLLAYWVQHFDSVTASLGPLISRDQHKLLGGWPSHLFPLKLLRGCEYSGGSVSPNGRLRARAAARGAAPLHHCSVILAKSLGTSSVNAITCDCWEHVQGRNPCEGRSTRRGPRSFGTRDQSPERQFLACPGQGDGVRVIRACYTYCALRF